MSQVRYDEARINQALMLLSKIPVQGPAQVGAMGAVYDILSHPIPEEKAETNSEE
jgi:hypothetical protein